MSTFPECPHCHRWSAGNKPCTIAKCLACETPQCFLNGTRNGTCVVCLNGHLEGWSWGWKGQPKCGYKGCDQPAVFKDVPRVGVCCQKCASRVKVKLVGQTRSLAELVQDRVQTRRRAHERVS